jgi:4-coumarate--CoA ligase
MCVTDFYFGHTRAYVVSTNNAVLLADLLKRAAFEKEVQEWVKGRVAKYKYLRGGVKVVEAIPKSGAGKILRRQLRNWAKKEAGGGVVSEPSAKAKL